MAELALRPIRSLASILPQGDPARTQIEDMAPAYRRACRMSRYSAGGWTITGRTPPAPGRGPRRTGRARDRPRPRDLGGAGRARGARAVPPDPDQGAATPAVRQRREGRGQEGNG